MRVTDEMLYSMLNTGIKRNQNEVYKLQRQVSSGKKVSWASDDPGTFELIQRLHADEATLKQYQRNGERVNTDMLVLEKELKSVLEIFQRASEIAITSGDQTVYSKEHEALAEETDMLLSSLVGIANTTDSGRYIFSGLRTSDPAYITADADSDGFIDTVTYQGSDEVRYVEVGRDVYVEANIPGSDAVGSDGVFQTAGGIDLFQNLMDLRDQLQTGAGVTGTTLLDDLNTGMDHVLDALGIVGVREEKVRISADMLNTQEVNINSALDREESIDIAEAVMELSKTQTAYEASIRAAAGVLGSSSLLDYL